MYESNESNFGFSFSDMVMEGSDLR
jgi:hypothetical protein